MAVSVFGNPITNSTLEGTPEFAGKKDIQKIDRARAALNLKNSDGKQDSCLKHLEKLKEKLGIIDGVATLCCVYNATGETVKFVTHHDWVGQNEVPPYPAEIENGQWAVFVHVRNIQVIPGGSVGAIVYRSKNPFGVDCDWMMAWNNPSDLRSLHNTVSCYNFFNSLIS